MTLQPFSHTPPLSSLRFPGLIVSSCQIWRCRRSHQSTRLAAAHRLPGQQWQRHSPRGVTKRKQTTHQTCSQTWSEYQFTEYLRSNAVAFCLWFWVHGIRRLSCQQGTLPSHMFNTLHYSICPQCIPLQLVFSCIYSLAHSSRTHSLILSSTTLSLILSLILSFTVS